MTGAGEEKSGEERRRAEFIACGADTWTAALSNRLPRFPSVLEVRHVGSCSRPSVRAPLDGSAHQFIRLIG